MKKRALRKEFYMEIKKSLGRFLSIFMIVALGVSFLSGIRASEPDMRLSGDVYFDKFKLMDMKVMGTLGISEDDVKELGELPSVAYAEGGYSTDVLCKVGDSRKVLHVMSVSDKLNTVAVEEGRMPENENECLMDVDFIGNTSYKIGDTIELESGTDDDLTDTLSKTELKIVGIGSSPCYISFERGSSMIGTGEVSGFLMVPEETFDLDVYTEAYLQVEGAEELVAFTPEYEAKIDKAVEEAEDIADVQCKARRDEIVKEASEELEDARQEFEDGKKEAEDELSKNEQKLKDGDAKLRDGKQQIKDGKKKIEDGRKALKDAKKTLAEKKKELDDGQKEYDDGKKEIDAGWEEFDKQKKAYDDAMKEAEAEFAAGEAKLSEEEGKLKEQKDALLAQKAALEQTRADLDVWSAEIERLQDEYELYISQPDYDEATAQAMADAIAAQKTQYDAAEEQYQAGYEQYQAIYDAAWPQIIAGEAELQKQRELFEAGRDSFDEEKKKNDAAFAENEAKLLAGDKELEEARLQIEDGRQKLAAGEKELKDQEKKLDDAAKELEDSEKEIADKEKELEDGWKEFKDAKKEVEEELADAEQEIADAEDELAKVEKPKWYVEDRSILTEYNSYGENADRMKAIGRVFPVLFFLVAALISLTTMTRMVEEQRMQIGTLKALGYSKSSIAGKYIGYALLATLGGSVFGVLVGEKIFPYIIVYAYKIMYIHIPDIVIPYHMSYAVVATVAAVACTMAATILACYKELASQPAVLMRPPSPKQGKRILMERITFIWKRLSFIWKSTLRNLFRYKKRFFMTIFGIGGCMALLLVGFGLKDSIFNIAVLQYDELQTYSASVFMDEEISDKDREGILSYLDEEKTISDYAEVYMKNVTLYSEEEEWDAYIMVPKDVKKMDGFVHLRDRILHTTYDFTDKGAVISEKTAKMLGVKKGDDIYLVNARDEKKPVEVIEICENYMGHYLYLTPAVYKDVYGREPEYNSILLKTNIPNSQNLKQETSPELQKVGENLLAYDDVMNVQYMDNIREQLDDMLGSLNIVIVVLIISAGMLAFVVLYNLNNININERKRELATIKVLGFYDLEVAEYVYRENILLTLIGAGVGCVLGNLLHRYIIVTVEVDAAMFGRIIHPASYIYSVLFTFAFSIIVNWVMYFKLKKINMVESLKSVE